jgi:hypothetical protein
MQSYPTDSHEVGRPPDPAAQTRASKNRGSFLSPVLRLSLILGICVHLLGFLFFRVVSEPLPERPDRAGFVQFVSSDGPGLSDALEEQAELMDTAPLFIPGPWNAAHNLPAPARDQALQRFPFYQPEIDVVAQLRPVRVPIGESFDVATPEDLLALRYWDLFKGFGERSPVIPELDSMGPFAEVSDMSGRPLRTIPASFDWPPSVQPDPAIFTLRIEASGRAVGAPALEQTSGSTDFDAAAYSWLSHAGVTADFQAGRYRIRIYP